MNSFRISYIEAQQKDRQMKTLEISVVSENSGESLIRISRLLAGGNVNLMAVTVTEVNQQQILKIIVEHPDIAAHILKDAGFQVEKTTVLAIALDDRPGAMAEVLELLAKNSLRPEYLYSILSGREKMADIIFKVNDPDKGESLLMKSGYSVPVIFQK
jgi:hypothetical protein